MGMELRLNLAILAALGLLWAGLTASQPSAAFEPGAPETRRLTRLEDTLAREPGNAEAARRLTEAYLAHGRPGLAIAALGRASSSLTADPRIAHQLARAYEATGRLRDARATAKSAMERCARSLGTDGASTWTPAPRFDCDAGTYARLDQHHAALRYMVRWGVTHPQRDPRARRAYELAVRRARIASAH